MVTNFTVEHAVYRRSLAYDLVLDRLTGTDVVYADLLDDAVQFGLDRTDLFRARQALGVSTKHRKWHLPTAIRVGPTTAPPTRRRRRPTPRWQRLV